MKKASAVFIFHILIIHNAWAQPLRDTGKPPVTQPYKPYPVDKSIVMDYFQNQQFEDALAYLQPAASADSNNITLLSWMGYANYMTDNRSAAETYYHRIVDLDSNNIAALYYLVNLNKSEGGHVIAMDYTARLIALQPQKALWWRTMGELFRQSNEIDSMISYHHRAYELAPTDYRNIVALADALVQKKDYHQADSILDIGLARDSLNLSMLRSRIRSAYNSQDYASAVVPGERIIRLNTPVLDALLWLSLSYYNLQKYTECVNVCEYLQFNGYDAEQIYYYEARALSKLKEYDKSNQLLNICLNKAISHTAEWYHNDMADNYESLKNYREAVMHYDTAYYLFKDPLMLYNCGRISESLLHNTAMARKYYRLYLATAHPIKPEEKKAYMYVRSRWGTKARSSAGKPSK